MITAMTEPTPDEVARKTQIVSVGGRSIVIRELTELQMMHLGRYANILQHGDVATNAKLEAVEKMLNILHACVANEQDRALLVAAEEAGEVSLTDLVSFVKTSQAEEEPKPAVRRGRVAARRSK
jgi:hypothetical protein